LETHLASSAEVVGEALTEAIVNQVNKDKLGYFPALGYFEKQAMLDADLLDAAETIGWFSARFAREEVERKLRPYFSSISFQAVKCTAYSMPTVRINQLNAYPLLVEHYTPNRVKLDIIASVLQKVYKAEGLENWARQLFRRNLESSFNTFEVIQAKLV
ncbi:MAG: hypothetical protein OEY43_11455, partial [Gammaproteobacteria bacterium]|nr:hypothetical protein [Gammaproteobacteria bacterium]